MRNTITPSSRWLKRWAETFVKYGGHPGERTLSAMRLEARRLYRLGGTAEVCGAACAEQYRLYCRLEQSIELSGD